MTKIEECLSSLLTAVQSIADLKNRSHIVYTPEKLIKLIKGVNGAQVGVVYEGMTGVKEVGATPKAIAKSAQFGIYLAIPTSAASDSLNKEVQSIQVLNSIGTLLEGKQSPTGHYWEFLSEAYADSFPDRALWVQRWSTKVISR